VSSINLIYANDPVSDMSFITYIDLIRLKSQLSLFLLFIIARLRAIV